MAAMLHPTSLTVLPEEVLIVIAGHLAAMSERPMDDLRSLRATCSSMRCICGDSAVGRLMALDTIRCGIRSWSDSVNYDALVARLAEIGNLEAYFLIRLPIVFEENHSPRPRLDDLIRVAVGGHNVGAYLVAILVYRHNGDAGDDDTVRQYIRQVEGEEQSREAAAGGGCRPRSIRLRNKGCVLFRRAAHKAISEMRVWYKLSLPPPAQLGGDLPCAGGVCGWADGWEGRAMYCSENCRLSLEIGLFEREIGIDSC